MQTLRIGSVDVESADPMVCKVLSQLKAMGVNVASPDAIANASEKLSEAASLAYRAGDKDTAEDLAHRAQCAKQAAIVLRSVKPSLLAPAQNILIDTGAIKLQRAAEAPAATVSIPPPADLKLPPGPGSGDPPNPVIPTTTQEAVAAGSKIPTVVKAGAALLVGAWLWKKLKKS